MFKKTILCATLAFAGAVPLVVHAAESRSTSAVSAINDASITARIKALYMKSPVVQGMTISVTTNDRKVFLSGTVKTDSQYEEAVALAGSVDGVEDLDTNNLRVKGSKAPLSDTLVTARVKAAYLKEKLFGKKKMDIWPVKVETKDGVVYLTGEVDSAEKRSNLIKLAKTVKGVNKVKSSITIDN